MRVLSVSTSRADVGILAPVWQALADDYRMELHVLLSGAHETNVTLASATLSTVSISAE